MTDEQWIINEGTVMDHKYTARLYSDNNEIEHNSDDDLERLHNWMLVKAQGKFGDISGEITDNQTHKVVKRFRKSPPD